MKRILPLLVLLACGEAKPPEPCGPVAQVTAPVGESITVEEVCFTDPEGGALTLSVTVQDTEIVTAGHNEDKVWVRGEKPGTTTVKVTATNPENQTGTLDFSVLVPNRPPTGSIADMTLPAGIDPVINLAKHYSDPDGQPLTYTASPSAPAVVSVAVTDSFLQLATMRAGRSEVSVTVSDGEGNHTDVFEVTVEQALFSDDFASATSLDNYEITDSTTDAAIEDSRLVVTQAHDDFFPLVVREFGGEAENLTVDVALRPSATGMAGFWVLTGDERYQVYAFLVGEADLTLGTFDWHFAWWDATAQGGNGGWVASTEWSLGESDDIDDDVTATVSLSLTDDDGLSVFLNGEEIIAPRTGSFLLNKAVALALMTWPKPDATGTPVSRMGWVGFRAEEFTEDDDNGPQAYPLPDFAKLKINPVQRR